MRDMYKCVVCALDVVPRLLHRRNEKSVHFHRLVFSSPLWVFYMFTDEKDVGERSNKAAIQALRKQTKEERLTLTMAVKHNETSLHTLLYSSLWTVRGGSLHPSIEHFQCERHKRDQIRQTDTDRLTLTEAVCFLPNSHQSSRLSCSSHSLCCPLCIFPSLLPTDEKTTDGKKEEKIQDWKTKLRKTTSEKRRKKRE